MVDIYEKGEQARGVASWNMLAGTIVGDQYAVEREVGRGARGVIFKAKRAGGKDCALKILTEDMLNDETAFDRFSMEAQTTCTLKHPHIINVFDFGLTDDGLAYLVMEYLEGQTLQQSIDSGGRLSIPRALNIFMQIADALEYAHSKGMIHRDIKPENIVLAKNASMPDFVKVVDFGIARRYNALPGADMLRTLVIEGTPGYMSPEQAMGGHLDARSDIYSLGCLMYTTLTGVMPITGATEEEILSKHISTDPPKLSQACPGALIPATVQEVVLKALKKFPEHRYQTAAQLKADLRMLMK